MSAVKMERTSTGQSQDRKKCRGGTDLKGARGYFRTVGRVPLTVGSRTVFEVCSKGVFSTYCVLLRIAR